MAGDVVPLDAVVVEIVQNGQTRFVVALGRLTIVRLRLAISAGVAPVAGVPLGRRTDFGARARPEPAILVRWLQIGALASSEIALAARCPDESHISTGQSLLDELIFLRGRSKTEADKRRVMQRSVRSTSMRRKSGAAYLRRLQ